MTDLYQGRRCSSPAAAASSAAISSRLCSQRAPVVRVLGRYSSSGLVGPSRALAAGPRPTSKCRLGTVSDRSFVDECVSDCAVVFHLAALIGIPYSYVAAAHNVETNVFGTLNVLEAIRRTGPERVVHTSTSECFGSAQYVPMDELTRSVAQSPYAATKVAADQLVGSYWRSFDVPAVTVRPFNTFGPRQSFRAVVPDDHRTGAAGLRGASRVSHTGPRSQSGGEHR